MPIAKILLVDLPPMLDGIVGRVLESRPSLRVVRGSAPDGLAAAAVEAGASLLVVAGADPANLCAVDPMLAAAAALAVLVLRPDGAWACLHALSVSSDRLDDISAASLLHAAELAVLPARLAG